jgi:hypothetical protein
VAAGTFSGDISSDLTIVSTFGGEPPKGEPPRANPAPAAGPGPSGGGPASACAAPSATGARSSS